MNITDDTQADYKNGAPEFNLEAAMARTEFLLNWAKELLKQHEYELAENPDSFAFRLMVESSKSRVVDLSERLNQYKNSIPTTEKPAVPALVTVLNFDFLFPSMNERQSHWQKTKLRNSYVWLIMAMTNNRHKGPVKYEYFRNSSASRKMDNDNLVSTTKLINDAIVKAGVILDDNQQILQQVSYEHVLLNRKVKPFTVIRITDI